MKHARVAYLGAVYDASEQHGRLRLADGRTVDETAVVWLPPVQPRTILALGLNYANHAKELGSKAPTQPLVFLKGPNTIVGHRAQTRRPADATFMHYECELAVVIGCTPLGPWLVDAGDVPDPMNLTLRTWVDGKLTQEGSTRDMIFDIAFLIEYLSSFMTLGAGDIILTGTPEGAVDVPAGAEVVTEIESIGRLVNTLVGDAA